jgi:hypothetical protein
VTSRKVSTAILEGIAVLSGLSLLVAAVTWPQARRLDAVPDLGDPLFSAWRLSCVAHHGAFATPLRSGRVVRALDANSDLELVAAARWRGSESRLYRFR